jgi:hypothetical protein
MELFSIRRAMAFPPVTGLQASFLRTLSFLPVRPAPTIVTQLVSQLCDQLQGLAS